MPSKVLPNGKKMVKLTMGEYIWETYVEAESRVSALAAGLRNLLGPLDDNRNNGEDFPTPLVLFSETRAEWLYAAEACWRLNRPVATLYASLGDDAIVHGLKQTEVRLMYSLLFCPCFGRSALGGFIKLINSWISSLLTELIIVVN